MSDNKRYTPGQFILALIISVLLVSQLWLQAIMYALDGNPWGHQSYRNLNVGTGLLLATLTIATPMGAYMLWKLRPRRWRTRRRKGEDKD